METIVGRGGVVVVGDGLATAAIYVLRHEWNGGHSLIALLCTNLLRQYHQSEFKKINVGRPDWPLCERGPRLSMIIMISDVE